MNAKHLQTLLEQGHRVSVALGKYEPYEDVIFHSYEEHDELFISDKGEYCHGYTHEEIEENTHGEYAIVTPAPKLLKVGDKVEILEIARELPYIHEIEQSLDREYVIQDVRRSCYDLNESVEDDTNKSFYLPFHVVAKVEDKL